jgi:hypothetical protein
MRKLCEISNKNRPIITRVFSVDKPILKIFVLKLLLQELSRCCGYAAAKFTTRPPWDYVAQFPVVTLYQSLLKHAGWSPTTEA